MPSSRKAVLKIMEELPQKGKVYELGSGFGHILFHIARKKSYEVIAYEISFFPWLFSVVIKWFFFRSASIRIYRKDFFSVSIKDADVVIAYLYPSAMRKLRDKFEKELKEESFIISNSFSIIGWREKKKIMVRDWFHSTIYVYTSSRTTLS